MNQILVIDDDKDVQELIKKYLTSKKDKVFCASNAKDGIKILLSNKIDCIVLDVLLENDNGFEVCRHLKRITNVPIIFLTNLDTEEDLKNGFLSGGDDYIKKPFSMVELHLRIMARIRQFQHIPLHNEVMEFPCLKINVNARSVEVSGKPLVLTISEFDILVFLAGTPNAAFTIAEIYQAVWKMPDMDNAHTVQVHIANLRKKMDAAFPQHHFIQTVWGRGYRFSPYIENILE